MLRRGEIVALEPTQDLLRRFSAMQLSLRLASGVLPPELRALETDVPPADARHHLLRLNSYDEVESILAQCRAAGCTFEEIEIRKADLEDVFVQIMHDPVVVEGLA